jgi:periplasmic protein TonB
MRSRRPGASWLSLVVSVSLHAAAFAIAAHFVTGSGGDEARPAAADAGEEMSLSVKIASPAQPRNAAQTTIRKALPAQQQRVFAAAQTNFALPPPEPALDLPEPRLPEKTETTTSSPDAPPSKKIASQTKKRGGGPASKGTSGSGIGSGNATAPRPIATRVPVYPYSAKKRGQQGLVLVRVRVNEAGRVESSTLYRSSGHAALDDAAVACVWKWNFAPGHSGGKAVESSAVVRVSFRLEG